MQLLNPMLRLAVDWDRRRQAQLGHAALDSHASELMHLLQAVALIQSARSPKTWIPITLTDWLRNLKTPACHRAINRMLAEMKKRWAEGRFR